MHSVFFLWAVTHYFIMSLMPLLMGRAVVVMQGSGRYQIQIAAVTMWVISMVYLWDARLDMQRAFLGLSEVLKESWGVLGGSWENLGGSWSILWHL